MLADPRLVLLLSTQLGLLAAQSQVWDLELCKARESHWTHNNHGYLYSGKSSLLQSEEVTCYDEDEGQNTDTSFTEAVY